MKTIILSPCSLTAVLLLAAGTILNTHAQGTAFTYQGRLNQNNGAATGTYDFRFRAATDPFASNYVGSAIFTNGVPVVNGLFTVALDFDGIFSGANIFLEVSVRTNGGGSYTTLSPLQPITPAPYAITSENFTGTVASSQIAGTYSGPVNFNNAGNIFTGAFAGNGNGLTNVNAATLGGLASSNFWQLAGNNVAPGQFLGSINPQPLELRAGGLRGLLIQPANSTYSNAVNYIAGSPNNYVAPLVSGATIGGGGTVFLGLTGSNNVLGDFGTVGGGMGNTASSFGTIAGGDGNSVTNFSSIGGGYANRIYGSYASIGGGQSNSAYADSNVIGGGNGNLTAGTNATIGGGAGNSVSGYAATVPGGENNFANGAHSFAAGNLADAAHDGVFVWSDGTFFGSTGPNQFLVHASGGVGINTESPFAALQVNGNAIFGNGVTPISATGSNLLNLAVGVNTNAFLNGISFYEGAGNTSMSFGYDGAGNSSHNALRIYHASGVPLFTFEASGNIGIGTTTPAKKLEVQSAGDSEIGVRSTDTNGHLWTIQSSGITSNVFLDASFQIIDRTLGVSRFYIGTNGSVGIGNRAPAATLDVTGTIAATSLSSAGTVSGGTFQNLGGGTLQLDGGFNNNVIAGSTSNSVSVGSSMTIAGGGSATQPNVIVNSNDGTIGGGAANTNLQSFGAVIAGGFQNVASNSAVATISGGSQNKVQFNQGSIIAGGEFNQIGGTTGFSAGGSPNAFNTISGGEANFIATNVSAAVIGGGYENMISNANSSIIGATIPGGSLNTAGGNYSFAAGFRANALHDGSFVWADTPNLSGVDFSSTSSNQFLIRASGGVGIGTNSPKAALHVASGNAGTSAPNPNSIAIFEKNANGYISLLTPTISESGIVFGNTNTTTDAAIYYNSGTVLSGLQFRTGTNSTKMAILANGNIGIGTTVPTNKLHVLGGITCTALTQTSDRNAKENFKPVSGREVLEKVAKLPISRWNFKELKDGEHLGPMAQDFYAAFGLGASDKTITAVDPDGVALAAIQGLNQKLEEKETRIKELEKKEARLNELEQRLAALEAIVQRK